LTNEILPENFKSQDKLGPRTVFLTLVSVIFIALSTIYQMKDNTEKKLQGIKEQLQKTEQTMQQIKQSQQGIDSSLKELKKDTFLGKTSLVFHIPLHHLVF